VQTLLLPSTLQDWAEAGVSYPWEQKQVQAGSILLLPAFLRRKEMEPLTTAFYLRSSNVLLYCRFKSTSELCFHHPVMFPSAVRCISEQVKMPFTEFTEGRNSTTLRNSIDNAAQGSSKVN